MRVLYLFAGTDRDTNVKSVLQKFSQHYGSSFTIECEEWDICRSPTEDLLDEGCQRTLLARIAREEFIAVIMSPPCASWSRAPWANKWGPRPLRTVLHPWGMPWLEGPKLEKVAASNCMIRFCLAIINLVHTLPGVGFLLEHPENLRSVSSRPSPIVRPASIWELPEVQAFATGRTFSVVFYQCGLGAKSRKPTRFLSNIAGFKELGSTQWPRLDKQGCYVGPLPPFCTCGRSHSGLIKRSAEDAFATTEAASYPPQLDTFIALAVWKFARDRSPTPSSPFGGQETQEKERERKKAEGAETQVQKRAEDKPKEVPKEQKDNQKDAESTRKRIRPNEQSQDYTEAEVVKFIESAERAAFSQKDGRALAPIRVHYKGRVRHLCDGLGKCSPGIRPAGHRGSVKSDRAKDLRGWFWSEVEEIDRSMSKQERLKWISKLALGRTESSPFEGLIGGLRERMDERLVALGLDPRRRKSDRSTPINFRRLKAWAEIVEDEDFRFLGGLLTRGVPLGVRGEIPWISQVYDKKPQGEKDEEIWRWDDRESGVEPRSNYGSAVSHMEKVREVVEIEVRKGWILRMAKKEAEEKFGGDLQLASLGAVPKDPSWEEVRVVHDGTHGISVNTEIRQPNRMPFPQFDDVEAAIGALKELRPVRKMLMAFDIKAAHRLIPVQEEDWGLQSFRLEKEGEVFVNMVGTFGVASAAFWWGRAASVIFRTFHRVVPPHLLFYLLLFADDGLLIAAGEEYHKLILSLFLFLDLMEVPLSWRKTRGGFQTEWIGYQVDLEGWKVGVSPKKVKWLKEWTERVLQESHLMGREFKAGVGRLGFLAGALAGARPFLAPLYAVSSRVGGSSYVELHLAVKLAIKFFTDWVSGEPMKEPRRAPKVAGEVFRIDAAADQDGISIGGWEVYGGKSPEEARWFSVKVTRKNCPWLYLKGEPFRTIAAAELLAVTMAVMTFKKEACWRDSEGRFSISGFTDNSSNTFVVDKFLSTKFPVSLVLMELAYQLAQLNATLSLSWIPREQNEEADDLTKGRFEKFDPKKKMEIDLEEAGFVVIPVLAEVAGRLDEEIKLRRVSKEAKVHGRKTPAEQKLRITQPW